MKKTLNRALLDKARASREDVPPVAPEIKSAIPPSGRMPINPGIGGAGSAWKAGAAEQNKAALAEAREQLADDVLNGRHELLLDCNQVVDRIGTDRRPDWQDQDSLQDLRISIEQEGQDTPIQVLPMVPHWKPDPLDPTNVSGVEFELITGRRRHAVCTMLHRKVRAVLVPPETNVGMLEHFDKQFIRFRENEERQDLSPFERLVSIGEMFDTLLKSNTTGMRQTAVAFAKRIHVHESVVSRARTVYRTRKQILDEFKNVYDMSYPELQNALASLGSKPATAKNGKQKPKKINVTKKVGTRNLSLTSQGEKLSISTTGLSLSKDDLDALGDVIADHLNRLRSQQ